MEKTYRGASDPHELKSPSELPAARSNPPERYPTGRSNPPANCAMEVRSAVALAVPEAGVKRKRRSEKTLKAHSVPLEFYLMMDKFR